MNRWCLHCGQVVIVQQGPLGPVHLTSDIKKVEGEVPELDWCEGPFTDTEPEPAQDHLTVVFDLCNGHDPIE